MVFVCDERLFRAGIAAPEQENHRLFARIQLADDRIGKDRPAEVLVAVRLRLPHGQGGVEEQHAALRPRHQTAVRRCGHAHIGLQLLKDILEAGPARGSAHPQAPRQTKDPC